MPGGRRRAPSARLVAARRAGVTRIARRMKRPELAAAFDAVARRELADATAVPVLQAALLRPGSSFIDVGAHAGAWLERLAAYAPHGRHLAFEPIPAYARRVAAEYPDIEVRTMALSASPGVAEFCYYPSMPGWSGLRQQPEVTALHEPTWIEVPVSTLDAEVGEKAVTLLKIDVEGAEFDVLRGGLGILEQQRPTIVLEHKQEASLLYGRSSGELWDLLEAMRMRVFSLDGTGPYARRSFTEVRPGAVNDWLLVAEQAP